jgi:SAM-dependent methyltransferase
MGFFPRNLASADPGPGPVIVWEEPDCQLCGHRNWLPLTEATDSTPGGTGLWFAVVQCQECGLCFTNPRPNAETIGQFYPPAYQPHKTPRRTLARKRWRWFSSRHPARQGQLIAWQGRGRLLDFGCGGGSFLVEMSRNQWKVTGVDVSAAAVQRVRGELGLRALVGSLPHPELEQASFDVITMWHSLEHVHAPLEVLRAAHRLLTPGGKLVVAVPNIDSLPFRWFGARWFGLDLPRHLTHFAPWTLHLMLERAGFKPGPIQMVRHSNWLRASARHVCQSGAATFWQRQLKTKPVSRLAACYCSLTRQSDCIMLMAQR